jgi:hypothetical protein
MRYVFMFDYETLCASKIVDTRFQRLLKFFQIVLLLPLHFLLEPVFILSTFITSITRAVSIIVKFLYEITK